MRLPRTLQPAPLLPRKIVLRIRLRSGFRLSRSGLRLLSRRGGRRFFGRVVLGLGRLVCGWRGGGLLARSLRGRGVLCRDRTRSLGALVLGRLVSHVFFLVTHLFSSFSTSIPRSLATVSNLAMSRRAPLRREVFSSSPVACRKRRLNASCLASISLTISSSSLRSCTSAAFTVSQPPRA